MIWEPLMMKDQITMAMIHEAFLKYMEGHQTLHPGMEWLIFKSLLLTGLAESVKRHGEK